MRINLQWARDYIKSKWFNVYYIALYWSQNYWLDTEKSDIDYKCIILPTLDDLVNNSKPYSSVFDFEWWQIDVKDIRAYLDSAVKCNINFIEILNTEYYLWDTSLREYFIPLQEQLWQLYLKACYWMILEKSEALRHKYPSTADKIEKYGYDPKQLHHIIRLRLLMQRYVIWDIWNYKHTGNEQSELIWIKNWNISNEEATVMADRNIYIAKQIRDAYVKEMTFEAKQEIIEKWKQIIKEFIITSIQLWK